MASYPPYAPQHDVGLMPMDARVLPDGSVVGRNDPRFFSPAGGGMEGGAGGGYRGRDFNVGGPQPQYLDGPTGGGMGGDAARYQAAQRRQRRGMPPLTSGFQPTPMEEPARSANPILDSYMRSGGGRGTDNTVDVGLEAQPGLQASPGAMDAAAGTTYTGDEAARIMGGGYTPPSLGAPAGPTYTGTEATRIMGGGYTPPGGAGGGAAGAGGMAPGGNSFGRLDRMRRMPGRGPFGAPMNGQSTMGAARQPRLGSPGRFYGGDVGLQPATGPAPGGPLLKDGGRVKKRRPVTIEHGYAGGGRASNTDAQFHDLRYNDAMPDWLKRQYQIQDGGEAGGASFMSMRDAPVDENGRQFMRVDERGDLEAGGKYEFVDPTKIRYLDGVGWVTDVANTRSTGKYEATAKRNRAIAMTVMAAGAAGGAMAAGGAFSGAAAPVVGAADADAAAVAAGLSSTPGAGTSMVVGAPGWAAEGGLAVTADGSLGAGAGGAGTASGGSIFSNPANWDRAARVAGGLASLGGSGGGRGGGQMEQIPNGEPGYLPPEGGGSANPVGRDGYGSPGDGGGGNPVARGGDAPPAYADYGLQVEDYGAGPTGGGGGGGGGGGTPQVTLGPSPGLTSRTTNIEDLILGEATKAGSDAAQQEAADRAAADIAQRFSVAKKAEKSRLIGQGYNAEDINKGAGLELNRLAKLDEAKASVGAQNIARTTEKSKGFDQRVQAARVVGESEGRAQNYDLGNRRIAADVGLGMSQISSREREGDLDRRYRASESSADRRFRSGESAADRTFRTGESNADRYWRTGERVSTQGWQGGQNTADRTLRRDVANADISYRNSQAGRQNSIDRGRGVGQIITGARDIYGFGSSAGWWADGGRPQDDVGLQIDDAQGRQDLTDGARVCGPGTTTSDSIPARVSGKNIRVSKTEGVLNSEAMELIDAEDPDFLERKNAEGLKIRAVREAMAAQLDDAGLEA